jgi:hypothetical protein
VKAACIAAAGGVQFSNSSKWRVGNYYPYSEPAVDPYEDLPTPEDEDDCDKTITISSQPRDYPINRSSLDSAGETVCITGGFTITGALTLGPATYVINTSGVRDDLAMNETGASLNCTGCTIILTNFSNRANTGNIRLTGGTVNISAPTEGPYAGVVLYQDREATDDNKRGTNHVNGNNESGVQGVIYMPGRSLLYNGGGGVAQNKCMQMIARRVDFTGNSKIKMGSLCGAAGMKGHSGGGWLVRLVA